MEAYYTHYIKKMQFHLSVHFKFNSSAVIHSFDTIKYVVLKISLREILPFLLVTTQVFMIVLNLLNKMINHIIICLSKIIN